MADKLKLASLYRYWITADSMNYHLRRSSKAPEEEIEGLPAELRAVGFAASTFASLSVWYALLYVVIEGYRELGCQDPAVDELLAKEDLLDQLRLFRNGTFHYQEEPLPEKLYKFIVAEDSASWISLLNKALDRFFTRELDIAGVAAALRQAVQPDSQPT